MSFLPSVSQSILPEELKIIFLDFDGVIVTSASKYLFFDRDCIGRLIKILDVTDAYIVVSSTWRHGMCLKDLQLYFIGAGIDGRRVIGQTPVLNTEKPISPWGRGAEISKWMSEFKYRTKKKITHYLVLDDDVADLETHANKQVKIESGLTDNDVEKSIQILMKEDK